MVGAMDYSGETCVGALVAFMSKVTRGSLGTRLCVTIISYLIKETLELSSRSLPPGCDNAVSCAVMHRIMCLPFL